MFWMGGKGVPSEAETLSEALQSRALLLRTESSVPTLPPCPSFPRHLWPRSPSPSPRIQTSHPAAHEAVVERQSDEGEGGFLDEIWVEDANLRGFLGHPSGHRFPEAI